MGTNLGATRPLAGAEVQDYVGMQNANQGSDGLHAFSIYEGEVLATDYTTRKMVVMINRTPVTDCLYAAGICASLFGVAESNLPPIGAHVVCLHTPSATYVLGTQPKANDPTEDYSNIITGATGYVQADEFPCPPTDSNGGESKVVSGYKASRDLLPGESEQGNNIGSVLRLLTNISHLEGGLALVEACIANDMVRICNQYFAHHNCGGDHLIWNNGRCNDELHFTSYPHEACGMKKEKEAIAEEVVDGVYAMKGEDDPMDATGRWRCSRYMGFLGDILHFWVTHPTEVVSTYAENAARAGRFHTWVGQDGTLMVQAAGDVCIDVNPHIVVPEILHKWDNSAWKPDEVMSKLDKEYLKIWASGQRWGDLNASVWQMRQYLKYLTLWHSLERFRQVAVDPHDKDKGLCNIPLEKDAPLGNPAADEKDKEKAGAKAEEPAAAHAILRMSPDGSISLMAMPQDPGGTGISSVIMNNGSVQIVAPYNVEIKAGGTFSVTAKDVSIRALKLVEVVSLCGALVTKARTAWKALCEKGMVWLKGDRRKGDTDSLNSEMPLEFNEYSVVIDASQGKTLVHGYEGAVLGSSGPHAPVRVEALNGDSEVSLYGHNINTVAKNDIKQKGRSFGSVTTLTNLQAEDMKLTDGVRVTPALIDILPLIRCNAIYCQSSFSVGGYTGPEEHVVRYDKEKLDRESLKPTTKDDALDPLKKRVADMKEEEYMEDYPKLEFGGKYSVWQFYKWESHTSISDPAALKADPWFDDAVVLGKRQAGGKTFVWTGASPIKATRTSSSNAPWPGKFARMLTFRGAAAKSIWEPWDRDFKADDIKTASNMEPGPLIYIFN